MHLDVGEVELTSHTYVPAASIQSHVSSDVLSDCKGTSSNGCLITKAFSYWEEWLRQRLDVSWFLCSGDDL